MYPDYIIEDVRQSLGYEEDDNTVDQMIYELDKKRSVRLAASVARDYRIRR